MQFHEDAKKLFVHYPPCTVAHDSAGLMHSEAIQFQFFPLLTEHCRDYLAPSNLQFNMKPSMRNLIIMNFAKIEREVLRKVYGYKPIFGTHVACCSTDSAKLDSCVRSVLSNQDLEARSSSTLLPGHPRGGGRL